jgi:hypothetical protein
MAETVKAIFEQPTIPHPEAAPHLPPIVCQLTDSARWWRPGATLADSQRRFPMRSPTSVLWSSILPTDHGLRDGVQPGLACPAVS